MRIVDELKEISCKHKIVELSDNFQDFECRLCHAKITKEQLTDMIKMELAQKLNDRIGIKA